MERDFELEYRELKQNETPDLWNRIEAGLSEKKIAAVPLENENKSIDIERFVVKKQTPWKHWGLLAAACLCVVIIFPAVMAGLIGSKSHSSSSDSAASTDLMESEAGGMAGRSESAAMEDADTSEEPKAEAVMPEITDGPILEGAIVQILRVDETGEETVYQAVVLEADADALMEAGMQIELICNDETQYDFVREPREERG